MSLINKIIVLLIVVIAIASPITCAEFRPDPVREFILSQPNHAIDMTRTRSQFKDNWELKKKNFKAGSRR